MQDLYRKVGQLFESIHQDNSHCHFGDSFYARIVRVDECTAVCPDDAFGAREEFAIWDTSSHPKGVFKDDLPVKRDRVRYFRKKFFRPCTEERLAERLAQVEAYDKAEALDKLK